MVDYLSNGRPEYESDYNNPYSAVGSDWFWMDLSIDKYFTFSKFKFIVTLEINNILNKLNAAIINPVTGRAYQYGDPVPNSYNDPLYPDVQAPLSPYPTNPARYLSPRQIRFGISLQY